jgi:hypothetical protein
MARCILFSLLDTVPKSHLAIQVKGRSM